MFYPGRELPVRLRDPDRSVHRRDATASWRAARARGNCPKIIHTNTGDRILAVRPVAASPPIRSATRDGAEPDNVRIYHFAGTQHVGMQPTMPKGVCAMPPNHGRLPRRCCAPTWSSLDRWVKDGTPPPPSRHPRIADGSLVETTGAERRDPGLHAGQRTQPAAALRLRPGFRQGHHRQGAAGRARGSLPRPGAEGRPRRQRDQRRAPARHRGADRDRDRLVGAQRRRPAAPANCAISTARICRSPRPRPSARRPATAACRSRSATAGPADYAAKVRDAAAALEKDGYLLPEDVERITARASNVAW